MKVAVISESAVRTTLKEGIAALDEAAPEPGRIMTGSGEA